jgi:hypothetical protein
MQHMEQRMLLLTVLLTGQGLPQRQAERLAMQLSTPCMVQSMGPGRQLTRSAQQQSLSFQLQVMQERLWLMLLLMVQDSLQSLGARQGMLLCMALSKRLMQLGPQQRMLLLRPGKL